MDESLSVMKETPNLLICGFDSLHPCHRDIAQRLEHSLVTGRMRIRFSLSRPIMSKHLTIDEKIKELEKMGYYFEKRENKYIFSHQKKNADNPYYYHNSWMLPPTPTETYSKREVAGFYKIYLEKGTGYKKVIKKLSSGKDRAAQRAMRAKDDFENAPSNDRIKEESTLGWDM